MSKNESKHRSKTPYHMSVADLKLCSICRHGRTAAGHISDIGGSKCPGTELHLQIEYRQIRSCNTKVWERGFGSIVVAEKVLDLPVLQHADQSIMRGPFIEHRSMWP